MRTLVLNAGYEPLAVVSFKRALVLVMNEKATIIASTVIIGEFSVGEIITRICTIP